jgi:hypothetical protein
LRLKFIGCDVLARLAYQQAAGSKHLIDFDLLELGLHIYPAKLRDALQAKIDTVLNPPYEAILLGYGLCGQSTAGLTAKNVPIIIPRAHDCITLFLGSRQKYKEQFEKAPGTYWFVQDYLERSSGMNSFLGVGANSSEELDRIYNEYVIKYGIENANYLMETLHRWQGNYSRAVFISTQAKPPESLLISAKEKANENRWQFETIAVDPNLITRLMEGLWDHDFLIVNPGETIQMIVSDDIIKNVRPES